MLLPLIKIKEVADRFQAHWTDAEAILGQPVVLQGGFGLSDFQGLIADFEAGTTDYVAQENKREGSLTNVSRLGRELRPRVVQFNRAVRALLPGSQVAGVLEVAPDAGMARAKQAEVFERVARLWEIVNLNSPAYPGFTPPLLLAGGYAQAQFELDIFAFRTASEANGGARQDERMARAARRDVAEEIWARMVQYRLVAQAMMPPQLVLSLPRITPKRKPKPKPEAEPEPVEP